MTILHQFEEKVKEAYEGRGRTTLWLGAALNIEAGELSEIFMKYHGYNKQYARDAVLSEAGDVLNFVTAILQAHELTLEQAIEDNIAKIKERGWVK